MTSCVSDGVILLASGRWSSPANLMAWPTADKGTFLLALLTNWNGLDRGKEGGGRDLGVGQSCDMRPVAGLLPHWACQTWQRHGRSHSPLTTTFSTRAGDARTIAETGSPPDYNSYCWHFSSALLTLRETVSRPATHICQTEWVPVCVLNYHVWSLELWQILQLNQSVHSI